MGTMIEQAIESAVDALIHQNAEEARAAMEGDRDIDQQERQIENSAWNSGLQQQPVARDLRVISAALKMITDMERIGDHAVDISELTVMMADTPYIKKLTHIEQMAKETMVMLISSLEAYVEKDSGAGEKSNPP